MSNFTIPGTTMPWNFTGGINSSYDFGVHDGTAPIVVASGLVAGVPVYLRYSSGTVRASASRSFYDANGDTTTIANGNLGSTLTYYPSKYTPGDYARPEYLICLMGAFTNSSGGGVSGGICFVGNGPINLITPTGATQWQLGVNDDSHGANSGNYVVGVSVFPRVTTKFSFPVKFTIPASGTSGGGSSGNRTGSGQIFPVGIS